MKKCKVLPMTYPEITSWNWVASLLSVLSSHENTKGWIYSNYIMLACIKENRTSSDKMHLTFLPFYPFAVCPFINAENFYRKTIMQHYKSIKELIINAINNNNYIYCTADQGFMFNREERFIHEMFIFGYDIEKSKAHVADFTFKGRYSYETVDMDLLVEAIERVNEEEDFLHGIRLMHYNEHIKYEFNLKRVKKLLMLYLNPDYMISDVTPNYVYGTDIYKMGEYQISETYANHTPWDVRYFHNLYDHKIMMVNRLNYMQRYGYMNIPFEIIEGFDNLSKTTLKMRNLCIKLNVTNSFPENKRLYLEECLKEVKEKEATLISELLACFKLC